MALYRHHMAETAATYLRIYTLVLLWPHVAIAMLPRAGGSSASLLGQRH